MEKDLTRDCMILVNAILSNLEIPLHWTTRVDNGNNLDYRVDEIIDYAVRKTIEVNKRLNIEDEKTSHK